MSSSLEDLRREICQTDPLNWLYPRDGEVLGFDGPGPFMLLSYRPSTNPWTHADVGRRRLYGMLRRLRLGDLHLSDCIKLRSPVHNDKAAPRNLDWHVDLLRREIGLINPPAMIISGRKAMEFTRENLSELEVPLIPVGHYANRFVSDEGVLVDLLAGILQSLKTLLSKGPQSDGAPRTA
jgi:hypothetical protein